ncbi:MAG: hypothetical protein JW997_05770 [Actinobacteria bacterium]|nr:hypothetical protein [Actinomycetota bacterium]
MGIIAVISNKGGVGKTSIALSTGFYLSKNPSSPTLIMELDSSPGDFGPIFDIDGSRSLEFAIRFPLNFRNYLKKIEDNLYVLKGIPNPFVIESITVKELSNLLGEISSVYENIVIDTQTVINRIIIDVCMLAERIMLITDCCLESVSRVVNLYEMLTDKYSVDKKKINFIVNKKRLADLFKLWDFSRITEIPVDGFISFDKSFNKNIFMADRRKLYCSRLYKQIGRLIENDCRK